MNLFKSKFIKKICVFSFVLISFLFINFSHAEKVEDLQINKYVNDFANIIDDNVEASLNQKLVDYDASTTNQIIVVTVNNMDGDYIEHYSIKLAEKIKAGTEKRDNGVILLVAKDDRQMRIEIGYGLEGALTDIESSRIINNILKPNFQKENYTEGVVKAVEAIQKSIDGEYVNDSPVNKNKILNSIFELIPFLFIGFIFFFQWIVSVLGRTKSWWLGGVLGFLVGLIFFIFLSTVISSVLLIILSLAGLAFDYFVSKNYKEHITNKKKGPPDWWAGGTWGSGGSHWGGGGFGGGGFSGGGGGFGGGGSSGSW